MENAELLAIASITAMVNRGTELAKFALSQTTLSKEYQRALVLVASIFIGIASVFMADNAMIAFAWFFPESAALRVLFLGVLASFGGGALQRLLDLKPKEEPVPPPVEPVEPAPTNPPDPNPYAPY